MAGEYREPIKSDLTETIFSTDRAQKFNFPSDPKKRVLKAVENPFYDHEEDQVDLEIPHWEDVDTQCQKIADPEIRQKVLEIASELFEVADSVMIDDGYDNNHEDRRAWREKLSPEDREAYEFNILRKNRLGRVFAAINELSQQIITDPNLVDEGIFLMDLSNVEPRVISTEVPIQEAVAGGFVSEEDARSIRLDKLKSLLMDRDNNAFLSDEVRELINETTDVDEFFDTVQEQGLLKPHIAKMFNDRISGFQINPYDTLTMAEKIDVVKSAKVAVALALNILAGKSVSEKNVSFLFGRV